MKRAIVTDVHYRMGLAAVRSLGRRPVEVTALEFDTVPKGSILGFYSRYTSDKRLVPSASLNQSGFIDGIIKLTDDYKGSDKPVLIPVALDSLMAVARYSSSLEQHADFIVPSLESMQIADDTNRLIEAAVKAGVPCPETTTLKPGETIGQLSERLKYPVVIKYRKGEALKLGPAKRYRIIRDPGAFIAAFSEMHSIQEFPIVQQYISGSGFGVSAVFDRKGEPLEIFCHKRLREYPVTGGPSCFCESIWDDRLVDHAVRLLKALNWRGVAMVEFKGDLKDGVYLMEVNPRFWGSLPLSIISGCDIPYAVYRAASGELAADGPKANYKVGKRMRFLLQDLLSVPGYLKREKSKARFLLKFTGQLLDPRIRDGILELRDWRPSLAYIRQAIRKIQS